MANAVIQKNGTHKRQESETTKPQTVGDAYDVIPVEGSDLVEIKRREIE